MPRPARLDRPETANWLAGRSPPHRSRATEGAMEGAQDPTRVSTPKLERKNGRRTTTNAADYHKVLPPGRRRPPCRDTKSARGRTPYRRPQTYLFA